MTRLQRLAAGSYQTADGRYYATRLKGLERLWWSVGENGEGGSLHHRNFRTLFQARSHIAFLASIKSEFD